MASDIIDGIENVKAMKAASSDTCGNGVAQNVKTSCFNTPSPLRPGVLTRPLGKALPRSVNSISSGLGGTSSFRLLLVIKFSRLAEDLLHFSLRCDISEGAGDRILFPPTGSKAVGATVFTD